MAATFSMWLHETSPGLSNPSHAPAGFTHGALRRVESVEKPRGGLKPAKPQAACEPQKWKERHEARHNSTDRTVATPRQTSSRATQYLVHVGRGAQLARYVVVADDARDAVVARRYA